MNDVATHSTKHEGAIHRIPELDGLRGIAIGMVLIFHLCQAVPSVIESIPNSVRVLSRIGQTGVDLFFVLSGFLITGILMETKDRPAYFRNFYMRRTLRIFPLYYGVLLGFAVLSYWGLRPAATASDTWMWLYLSNIPVTFGWGEVAWPHFWSLAVEEQFYLFWPFVVLAFSRRMLLRACVVLFFVAAGSRALLLSQEYSAFWLLPCRMDALVTGAAISILASDRQGLELLRRHSGKVFLVSAVVTGLLFVWGTGKGWDVIQITKFSMISLMFGAAVSIALTAGSGGWVGQILTIPQLRTLGKYSYGVYVFHPFFIEYREIITNSEWGGRLREVFTSLGWDLLFILGGTALITWISWHCWEQPFLSLKSRFQYRGREIRLRETISQPKEAESISAGLSQESFTTPAKN